MMCTQLRCRNMCPRAGGRKNGGREEGRKRRREGKGRREERVWWYMVRCMLSGDAVEMFDIRWWWWDVWYQVIHGEMFDIRYYKTSIVNHHFHRVFSLHDQFWVKGTGNSKLFWCDTKYLHSHTSLNEDFGKTLNVLVTEFSDKGWVNGSVSSP